MKISIDYKPSGPFRIPVRVLSAVDDQEPDWSDFKSLEGRYDILDEEQQWDDVR